MFGPGGEGHCSMPTPAELTVVIDGGGGEIEIPTGHGVSHAAAHNGFSGKPRIRWVLVGFWAVASTTCNYTGKTTV